MGEMRKRGFAAGYLLGLGGMPLAAALGQENAATLYAYSGVVHPALPEGFDHLPYATILFREDVHCLYLSDRPFYALIQADGTFNLYNNYRDVGIRFASFQLHYDADGSEFWSYIGFQTLSIGYLVAGPARSAWANYHMYDKTGAVHIRASAPIPVSGGRAMALGCRLGYILRRQMGGVPDGVLLSSDGYILRDCSGMYMIAKEDA